MMRSATFTLSSVSAAALLAVIGTAAGPDGAVAQVQSGTTTSDGEAIYRDAGCVGCHGMDGTGRTGVAPTLDGNPQLRSANHVATQILVGHGTMPAFAAELTDEEVAAVGTYVRTAWSNDFGPLEPETVASVHESVDMAEAERTASAGGEGTAAAAASSVDGPAPAAPSGADAAAPGEPAKVADAGAQTYAGGRLTAEDLLHVPVVDLIPGAAGREPLSGVPDVDDTEAIQRGKAYFNQFNCVGCHAPHGAGGMGPSLSNATFLYGDKPEQIYLTLAHGRPKGMPAWGEVLPDEVMWDLVAYVRAISRDPDAGSEWGRTTSLGAFRIEQVPAGEIDTIEPWQHTRPFSFGQPSYADQSNAPEVEDKTAR